MGLFKLLALGFIAWLVIRTLKGWRIEVTRREDFPGVAPGARAQDRFEPMTRCARCGVHLPPSVLSAGGRCGACERA